MKPRDDNPEKYRDNVRKSWRIMYSVVSQIKDVCYIAHLEPNPGVGYDCLSLLTKKPGRDLETNILLNRNGSNGLVNGVILEKVWDRAESDEEISPLADELISRTKLQKVAIGESLQSTTAQIAKYVVDCINCLFAAYLHLIFCNNVNGDALKTYRFFYWYVPIFFNEVPEIL